MSEKRSSVICGLLVACCASIMITLMILLFIEYRFFCRQAHDLRLLKQEYADHIAVLQKKLSGDSGDEVDTDVETDVLNDGKLEELATESSFVMDDIIAAENSDAPDNDDDYVDDSFIIINRHPDYLRQSTMDYFEAQELNSLMTAIDIDVQSSFVHKSSHASSKEQPKKPNTNQLKQHAMASAHRIAKNDCGFIWPIDTGKFWLSSLFGPRKRIDGTWGFHHGIDMAAPKGTVVKAARAGTVVEASFQAGYGNTVVIKHTEAIKTRYAHLNAIRVHIGQKIKQGVMVGTVGETGFVRKKGKDGSHLHFEVYEHGKRINPMQCLPRN